MTFGFPLQYPAGVFHALWEECVLPICGWKVIGCSKLLQWRGFLWMPLWLAAWVRWPLMTHPKPIFTLKDLVKEVKSLVYFGMYCESGRKASWFKALTYFTQTQRSVLAEWSSTTLFVVCTVQRNLLVSALWWANYVMVTISKLPSVITKQFSICVHQILVIIAMIYLQAHVSSHSSHVDLSVSV